MKRNLVVRRLIDAPVEKVWRAWTEPDMITKWWGPDDFTSPSAKVDLREGGKFIFCMRSPDYMGSQDQYTAGTYTKILPMQLLEFTQALSDESGNPIDPTTINMPADFPAEIRTTVEFKKHRGDMTELIITEYDWSMGNMAVYAYAGLQQSMDKFIESIT